MKIFNKENEKEKAYVQLNDIMELIQTNNPIPASVVLQNDPAPSTLVLG